MFLSKHTETPAKVGIGSSSGVSETLVKVRVVGQKGKREAVWEQTPSGFVLACSCLRSFPAPYSPPMSVPQVVNNKNEILILARTYNVERERTI